MILPRSATTRNAPSVSGIVIVILAAAGLMSACALAPPAIPPNVLIEDAHPEGFIVSFNQASTLLASGDTETIRLWRLPEAEPIAAWRAHAGSIHGLEFIENDTAVLSASYDGSFAVWTLDGRLQRRLATPAPIADVDADIARGVIVTGHSDGYVRSWSLPELRMLSEERRHDGEVLAVAFHAASGQFASSGLDGRVFVWNNSSPARELPPPTTDAVELQFNPQGSALYGGAWFRLYRWQLPGGALEILPTEHFGTIKSMHFAHTGDTLATISRETDSSVYLLDARTGSVVTRLAPHDLCGAYIRFSPDERYLATTSDDASVRVWDLKKPLTARPYWIQ